jgi:hypothetical protein
LGNQPQQSTAEHDAADHSAADHSAADHSAADHSAAHDGPTHHRPAHHRPAHDRSADHDGSAASAPEHDGGPPANHGYPLGYADRHPNGHPDLTSVARKDA